MLRMSDTDTCNTLFVNRPENMDVYLDRDITDWGEDTEAFITGDHRGEVLIIDRERACGHSSLNEYLESLEPATVGPFSVYAL